MARYTGAQCKLCRREGMKLFLKGDRCYTNKCAFDRRGYAPGQHGQVRKKFSEYGLQLRAKQKARRIYGIMEKQFRNYFYKAARQSGVTGENLLRLLEKRLDNVIFRLGLADSRVQARQMVTHGHFEVNGRKVNIPSYLVKVRDEITVREKSKNSDFIKGMIDRAKEKSHPEWLEFDADQIKGRVVSIPTREQIDVDVEEHLIVELYSK